CARTAACGRSGPFATARPDRMLMARTKGLSGPVQLVSIGTAGGGGIQSLLSGCGGSACASALHFRNGESAEGRRTSDDRLRRLGPAGQLTGDQAASLERAISTAHKDTSTRAPPLPAVQDL